MSQETKNFSTLGLSEILLKAIADLQFEKPSAIQEQTIPWLLQGRDLIGQAQTGTGKTAAFALPILQNLSPKSTETQALILAPTRELAIQVAENFKALGKYVPGINISILCGGQDYRPQLQALRQGANVVVGTPGRILDHIEKGTLKLGSLKTFVLDEADEMLRMGFIEDVETILSKLPAEKQMALFSATMPGRIRQIANRYLKEPVSVEIKMETATVKSIEQRFIITSVAQKPDALMRVLAAEDYQGVIVFVRTKSSADEVAQFLQQQNLHAMSIHGDLTQSLRERIISQFKQGTINILVATDVAARGLDVDRVTHVINYDMAHDCETYVHRIGRTGRAGRSGVTILFASPRESRMLGMIEKHTRQRIEKMNVPNDFTIQQVKQQRFLSQITERLGKEELQSHKKMLEEYISTGEHSPIDIAAALSLLINKDKAWTAKADMPKMEFSNKESKPFSDRASKNFDSKRPKFGKTDRPRFSDSERSKFADSDRPKFSDSGSRAPVDNLSQVLYRIDVGRIHGVKPGNIVGAIANEANLQSRFITGLKIHDYYSTVYLPKGMSKEAMTDLNKAWVCGRQLKITQHSAA